MTKRVFIVHGWDNYPKDNWFPWLKKELDNQDDFKNKLGSKIVIEHNMGHFNDGAGITQLPIALKSLLEISK